MGLIPNWGNMTILRVITLASLVLTLWTLWRSARRKTIIVRNPSPTSGPRLRQGAIRGHRPKPRPAPYHLPMLHPRTPAMKRPFPLIGKTRSTPGVTQAKLEPTALNSVSSEPVGNPMPPPTPRIVIPQESVNTSTPDCTKIAIPCPKCAPHRITSHLRVLDPERYRLIPLDDLEREGVTGRGTLSTSLTIDPTLGSTTNIHPSH